MLFSPSNRICLAAETTSSVHFRPVTRVGAGTSTGKCRFGTRHTEPCCVPCPLSDCPSFSSHTSWQGQLPVSLTATGGHHSMPRVTALLHRSCYSPCSYPQLENLSSSCTNPKIELKLLCTLLDHHLAPIVWIVLQTKRKDSFGVLVVNLYMSKN